MKNSKTEESSTFEEYFSNFEDETRTKLEQMRQTIAQAAPGAKEVISYAIPTYVLNGNLVHFAAYKNHIGFYPGTSGIKIHIDELTEFKKAKGSVQFPLNKPLPIDTITKIVKFRVAENLNKKKT